jgi:tyrosyl-tRNA synthetase
MVWLLSCYILPAYNKLFYLSLPCRCCQIMGRSDQEELTAAQIFYPCMQCADIFFLKVSTLM